MEFPFRPEGLIKQWGLSPESTVILGKRPELVERLSEARKQPQLVLTPGISPARVDYLMDDLPYICMEHGQLTYYRKWEVGRDPFFWELQINDEIAVFAIQGEYVVNRLQIVATANV